MAYKVPQNLTEFKWTLFPVSYMLTVYSILEFGLFKEQVQKIDPSM